MVDIEVVSIKKSDCEYLLELGVKPSRVKSTLQNIYQQLQKEVSLPGFRKGKVPLEKIQENYKDIALERLYKKIIPEVIEEVLKEKEIYPVILHPVSKIDINPDLFLHFQVKIETLPEFELKNYKNIKLKRNRKEITAQDIDKSIEKIREMNATLENISDSDNEVRENDYVIIDYQMIEQGVPLVNRKQENQLLEVNEKVLSPDFYKNLLGKKKGEEVLINTKDSEDKDIQLQVKIKDIKRKILPIVNEDFVKGLGEESLDLLKEKIKKSLQEEAEKKEINDLKNQIADYLLNDYQFPLPPTLVEKSLDEMIKRAKEYYQQSGKELSVQEAEKLRTDYRKYAENEVKLSIILGKIMEKEKLDKDSNVIDFLLKQADIKGGD